jgi:hypothetical protein
LQMPAVAISRMPALKNPLNIDELSLLRGMKDAAKQKPGIREAGTMASATFFGRQADATFFRRQAERCADLARRTHDEDSRQRCEQLERTYCYLAEMEERQSREVNASSGAHR